jgi:hypothetical protein
MVRADRREAEEKFGAGACEILRQLFYRVAQDFGVGRGRLFICPVQRRDGPAGRRDADAADW